MKPDLNAIREYGCPREFGNTCVVFYQVLDYAERMQQVVEAAMGVSEHTLIKDAVESYGIFAHETSLWAKFKNLKEALDALDK